MKTIANNTPRQIHMQLIPIEERKKATCAICGTKLSVKYKLSDNSKERYCNRCITKVV